MLALLLAVVPVGVWNFLLMWWPVLIPAWCLLGMQVLVRCGWEVLDTLGPVRVEILLVSPPSPTVTIRTPTSQVPHTATSKARMRATFNPALLTLLPPLLRGSITVIYYLIPYWCCCPPEKVLVVIYYLILLPPLYWGHNAVFTVENATYGPTGENWRY